MTDADVIALTSSGIAEDVILAKVRAAPANSFDTSVDGLKALQAAHVSSAVIHAMIDPHASPAQPAYASAYSAAMANASSNDPSVMHPPGIYMYAGAGQSAKLTKLDAATFRQTKGKNVGLSGFTYGIVKYKVLTVVEHPTSPIESADPNPTFYLYSPPDDYSFRGSSVHVADFLLVKLDQKADSREMQSGTGSPWGHSVGTDDKARRGFSYAETSPGIFKLTLVEPLPPGQYAFSPNKTTLYDFGIDPAAHSNPAVALSPVAPPPPPVPPPPATGIAGDFPAGPGLPVLHTSRTPAEGCHWAPFVSKDAGIALLVQQCAAANSTDTKSLVSVHGKGQGEIQVFSKPPGQTLDTAIRQQAGASLPAPVRAACHAVLAKQQWEHSTWKQYDFTVTSGPLLRKYKTAEPGDNLPCDPWEQVDTSVAFLYQPSKSEAKFLFVQMGQEEPSWDVESIQFLAEP